MNDPRERFNRLPKGAREALALAALALVLAVVTAVLRNGLPDIPSAAPIPRAAPAPTALSVPVPTPALNGCGTGQTLNVLVTKVSDGDTIHVDACGADRAVRTIGPNTPETVKPRSPVQCYGPEASTTAKQRLSHRMVILTPDKKSGYKEKFGRWLYFVDYTTADGKIHDYAAEMISAGLAEANDYGHKHARDEKYRQLQDDARARGAGAWGACPDPFRK